MNSKLLQSSFLILLISSPIIYGADNISKYSKYANQGSPVARFNLGLAYDIGKGTRKNYQKAVFWYQKSAQQNNSNAQNNLATMLEKGHGTKKDLTQAFNWYQKSATNGNESAKRNLVRFNKKYPNIGQQYYFKAGLNYANNGNYRQAKNQFSQSAQLGNKKAQGYLKVMETIEEY